MISSIPVLRAELHASIKHTYHVHIFREISLFNSGEEVIPFEDYLLFVAEEIGIGKPRKQNHELFHVTFHEQDVNMGGQMCDREKMYTFEDYFKKNEIKQEREILIRIIGANYE